MFTPGTAVFGPQRLPSWQSECRRCPCCSSQGQNASSRCVPGVYPSRLPGCAGIVLPLVVRSSDVVSESWKSKGSFSQVVWMNDSVIQSMDDCCLRLWKKCNNDLTEPQEKIPPVFFLVIVALCQLAAAAAGSSRLLLIFFVFRLLILLRDHLMQIFLRGTYPEFWIEHSGTRSSRLHSIPLKRTGSNHWEMFIIFLTFPSCDTGRDKHSLLFLPVNWVKVNFLYRCSCKLGKGRHSLPLSLSLFVLWTGRQ